MRPDADSVTQFTPFVEVDEWVFDALLADYRLMKETLEAVWAERVRDNRPYSSAWLVTATAMEHVDSTLSSVAASGGATAPTKETE